MRPRVRCPICRRRTPTRKILQTHLLHSHSKHQIINHFLTATINATILKTRARRLQHAPPLANKLHVTFNNETIIIADDDRGRRNLIELTFEGNVELLPPRPRKRRRRPAGGRKTLQIGIRRIEPASLDAHSGEFYECHCMVRGRGATSDTESCSDTGRSFYCDGCGSGYQTRGELVEHARTHRTGAPPCQERHFLRIYVCHLCGSEFLCVEMLRSHMEDHYEQQTFEDVLNMEQDYNNLYNFYNTSLLSGDYYSDLSNIMFFLTYTPNFDRNYIKVCEICLQQIHVFDYDKHMKIVHFFR